MKSREEERTIHEEDIEARNIERRTFLGRFGAAAGMASLLSWSSGCAQGGSESDSSDSDSSDSSSSDSDSSDSGSSDSDSSDS